MFNNLHSFEVDAHPQGVANSNSPTCIPPSPLTSTPSLSAPHCKRITSRCRPPGPTHCLEFMINAPNVCSFDWRIHDTRRVHTLYMSSSEQRRRSRRCAHVCAQFGSYIIVCAWNAKYLYDFLSGAAVVVNGWRCKFERNVTRMICKCLILN